MKHLKALVLLLLLGTSSFAQIVVPRHWSFRADHLSGNEYNLVFTMDIDKPWHGYSQKVDGDAPMPTSIAIDKNPDIELIGTTTEGGPNVHVVDDKAIGEKIKIFEDRAIFTQHVRVKKSTTATGSVTAQVCDDKSCLPPEEKPFSIKIALTDGDKKTRTKNSPDSSNLIASASQAVDTPTAQSNQKDTKATSSMTAYYQNFFDKSKFAKPISDCGQKEEPLTTWLVFLFGLGGGLAALLTPCVFPMIPLTVSFFIKRSENNTKGRWESVFYGFCIMLIFFLLSLPFLFFNLSSNSLNALSTNMWYNLAFFFVFIVFAISFFGYYDIALPSSLATKVDSASNAGGLIGIFFMALTLVIVSFSCTGPLIGTLLGSLSTAANGKLNLVVGMTSFGFAMGLPFTLFAFFPDLLKKLPRSGGWMDTVKKFFGFAELILAMKFLSNADLVGHWGIVKKEIFLAVWVALGLALFLYLIGVIRFKSESPINRKAPIRIIIASLVFIFTAYCAYGLSGHEVKLLSGFIPPDYYSIFPKKTECPDDLSCFHDYDEAVAYARKVNKPVFIDFTGYNCANCRKMEETIWTNPDVYQRMSQKYVIVSLYVDDNRKKLPENMIYNSPDNGDKRTSYGDKWSDFQAICFNTNTQPQYVLISPDEKLLNNSWKGYDADPKKFKDFLDCGLTAYATLQPAK
jgi:thiol:disulfide interchange protein DsbD